MITSNWIQTFMPITISPHSKNKKIGKKTVTISNPEDLSYAVISFRLTHQGHL
jgi:hypothetical protein